MFSSILIFSAGWTAGGLLVKKAINAREAAKLHRDRPLFLQHVRTQFAKLSADLATFKQANAITPEDENAINSPHRVFLTIEDEHHFIKILTLAYLVRRLKVYKLVLDHEDDINAIKQLSVFEFVENYITGHIALIEEMYYGNNPDLHAYVRFKNLQNDLLSAPNLDPMVAPRYAALPTYIELCVTSIEGFDFLYKYLLSFLITMILSVTGEIEADANIINEFIATLSNIQSVHDLNTKALKKIARTEYLIYCLIKTLSEQTEPRHIFKLEVEISTYKSLLVLQSLELYHACILKRSLENGTQIPEELLKQCQQTNMEYNQFHQETYPKGHAHTIFFIEPEILDSLQTLQAAGGFRLHCYDSLITSCEVRAIDPYVVVRTPSP